jgi:hypothetical protein
MMRTSVRQLDIVRFYREALDLNLVSYITVPYGEEHITVLLYDSFKIEIDEWVTDDEGFTKVLVEAPVCTDDENIYGNMEATIYDNPDSPGFRQKTRYSSMESFFSYVLELIKEGESKR